MGIRLISLPPMRRRHSAAEFEAVRLIRKYYPNLGRARQPTTVSPLAAEWYSDIAVTGIARLEYLTTTPYEKASNKPEFLACLDILLTEAEKYSHQRGYGWRQHFAATDLNPTIEARLEVSGNETIRAVRDWHTETSLPPVEAFLHRVRKIELWQNEQHQLTTLGMDANDWRDVYNPLFLDFRRAIYRAENSLLRTAYMEMSLLLPTLHTRWLPRMDENTGEEIVSNIPFHAGQLVDYWLYCEFVPLQPTSTTHSQRDPCLMAWLSCHINMKQWYVWEAVKLLAGILNEPAPEIPLAFQPPVPKPVELFTSSWPPEPSLRVGAPAQPSAGAFESHLLNYTLADLTHLLTELGLLHPATGQATPVASPGAWVGVIYALLEAKRPRLKGSKAAIWRAFESAFAAVGSERVVQNGLGTRGSTAEQFRDRALNILAG